MTASVRQVAGRCLGLSGGLSILGDFFGFSRRVLPTDPTGAQISVSLRRQLQRLDGFSHNLNVIQVGSDQFTDGDRLEIDYAIFRLRNIDDQVQLGVGRVRHYVVPTADADGLDTPTTLDELEQLTRDWTVPNDGIDMFIPHNMSVSSNGGTVLGASPRNGPCDKDAKGMNGSTCGLWGQEQTARSLAHELGHYLGLEHRNRDGDNLMCQSGHANSTRDSVQLSSDQGDTMRGHCSIAYACR